MEEEIVYYNPDLQGTPTHIICPKCQSPTNTNVVAKNTMKTHLLACLMALSCCCLCAWLPYTVNDCRSVRHYCQKCNRYVGNYESNFRLC